MLWKGRFHLRAFTSSLIHHHCWNLTFDGNLCLVGQRVRSFILRGASVQIIASSSKGFRLFEHHRSLCADSFTVLLFFVSLFELFGHHLRPEIRAFKGLQRLLHSFCNHFTFSTESLVETVQHFLKSFIRRGLRGQYYLLNWGLNCFFGRDSRISFPVFDWVSRKNAGYLLVFFLAKEKNEFTEESFEEILWELFNCEGCQL